MMSALRDMMLGVVIFGAVMTFGTMFVSDMVPGDADTQQLDKLDKTGELHETTQKIQESITEIDVANPLSWGNVVNLVVDIGTLLVQVPVYIHQMVQDAVLILNLPTEIAFIIELAASVIVALVLFSAINKYRV